jgi:hypothetical protein
MDAGAFGRRLVMGFSPATVLMGVGAVVSLVQNVAQGLNASANYQNQARAAETNSRIAAMNADIAGSQGRLAAAQTAQDWYKQLGRQRAAMAEGGVLESPTGLLVRQEAEERAKGDEFQVQLNTDLKKQGYLFESADYLNQASVARSNASQARLGGYLGGIGSFAGGMSNAYAYESLYGKKP